MAQALLVFAATRANMLTAR